ncbi:MAG: hypothetical protein A2Y53_08975 [Chloroflexi bacterium RBG_16_47_49]|nr:MAG: hypothetical protein A2Y53_08975 [Chloroflexi bacterium RBG_16_47_49]
MKKSYPILVGILICLVVIGVSYFWATALMDSMYAYRSPLQNSPPIPGEPIGKPNTRSLVVVLIDALRYDTSTKPEVMPFLNQLRTGGASAMMHSRPPSYSEPAYTVLLTGAWPEINDGPVINLDYADIPTFTQDDIFSASYRAGLFTAISGFYWFEKLVPQEAVSASFYTPGEDQLADRQVTDAALPWLREGKYSLVLIHLDQVDFAGHHEGGPMDPRWDAAATRVDGLLNEIASTMDLTQDTLLVVSDHGQIDRGGHGGQDPIVLLEPFVLAGKGVIPGDYGDIDMVDVAPTIAAILGTNIPATDQGRPRIEMLDFTLAQVNKVNQVLSIQQGQLATAYETAIGQPVIVQRSSEVVPATQEAMDTARESRLNNERILRGIFTIVLLILVINLAAWHARPHLSWILGGVVVYLLFFNLKYILIDHKTYSLSSVVNATNLIVTSALVSFIALAVSWLLVLLGTRAYQFRPRKAAETTLKFILCTLSIFAVPIFIHYAVNGATVTWALPNFLISFLGLLALIQCLVVAAIGLALTGLSALIGIYAHD